MDEVRFAGGELKYPPITPFQSTIISFTVVPTFTANGRPLFEVVEDVKSFELRIRVPSQFIKLKYSFQP